MAPVSPSSMLASSVRSARLPIRRALCDGADLRADAPHLADLLRLGTGLSDGARQPGQGSNGFRRGAIDATGRGEERIRERNFVRLHELDRGSAIAARHFQSEG